MEEVSGALRLDAASEPRAESNESPAAAFQYINTTLKARQSTLGTYVVWLKASNFSTRRLCSHYVYLNVQKAVVRKDFGYGNSGSILCRHDRILCLSTHPAALDLLTSLRLDHRMRSAANGRASLSSWHSSMN